MRYNAKEAQARKDRTKTRTGLVLVGLVGAWWLLPFGGEDAPPSPEPEVVESETVAATDSNGAIYGSEDPGTLPLDQFEKLTAFQETYGPFARAYEDYIERANPAFLEGTISSEEHGRALATLKAAALEHYDNPASLEYHPDDPVADHFRPANDTVYSILNMFMAMAEGSETRLKEHHAEAQDGVVLSVTSLLLFHEQYGFTLDEDDTMFSE